jgi:hypothetical protein
VSERNGFGISRRGKEENKRAEDRVDKHKAEIAVSVREIICKF